MFKQIKCLEIEGQLNSGAVLVDIRRQDEWEMTGVITGSLLLTFFDQAGNSLPEAWLQQLDSRVPVDQPILLICRSGYRTGLVADFLCQVTPRQQIYNVTGGILAWLAAGLPVVPLSVHLDSTHSEGN